MLIPLLQNLSMLLAVVVIYALIAGGQRAYLSGARQRDLRGQILTGLVIGLIATAMILEPVRYGGVLLDARSVLLSVTALFFGTVPSLVALGAGAAARIYVGGQGAPMGIVYMVIAVAVGLAWRRVRRPRIDQLSLLELYLFGLAVQVAIDIVGLLIPRHMTLFAIRDLAMPTLALYPLAEAAIGGLLVRLLRQETLSQAVKVSEERYRVLADNVRDIILQHDLDWRILYVSPSVRQLGYEPADLVGQPSDFTHPEDAPVARGRMDQVRLGVNVGNMETRVRRADGTWAWVDSNPSAIHDAQGKVVGVLSVWRDITQRKESEAAMREMRGEMARVARISALGAFSASIAHEINQPLAAMIINTEAAQRLMSQTPPDMALLGAAVDRAARDARRAGEIIARMRSMTTRAPPAVARFRLGDAISEVLALSQGELQRWNVSTHTSLPRRPVLVHGDRVQIQQVVLNLIQNAIEAMRDTPQDERLLLLRCEVENSEIKVEVEDRGSGLGDVAAETMFEHLFTTKEGGTGLGLTISKSILEAHRGRISAEPAHPRGAVFRFHLPLAGAEVETEA